MSGIEGGAGYWEGRVYVKKSGKQQNNTRSSRNIIRSKLPYGMQSRERLCKLRTKLSLK